MTTTSFGTITFPSDVSVGEVFVVEGRSIAARLPAQGTVEVPAGERVNLQLREWALGDLSGLDVATPLRLAVASATTVALADLSRFTELETLTIGEPVTDAGLAAIATVLSLTTLQVSLAGPALAGVAALATLPLMTLELHGDPGDQLGALASIPSLDALHLHLPLLSVESLRPLEHHLTTLTIEVAERTDADEGLVEALVGLAAGLVRFSVDTPDGDPALPPAAQVALIRAYPDLNLNGITYTAAAAARLERKLNANPDDRTAS